MNNLKNEWNQNKKKLCFALAVTFAWGMLTHGYGFAQSAFSHDSLNEFNGSDGGNFWKIQLGRFVIPAYRAVFRTDLTLPWMIGMLSLLWIGLAVYLVIRIFNMDSKLTMILTAGIFATNITVTATAATYLHDYDCDMFAMFCTVAAVYCWRFLARSGILWGAMLTVLALGIYQSYISVTVVLVIIVCILDLLNEESFQAVFSGGMKAIGMLLLGGILYYIVMKLVLTVTEIPLSTGGTNSLDAALSLTPKTIVYYTVYAYVDCFNRLWNMLSVYPAVVVKTATMLLGLIICAAVIIGLCQKKLGRLEKLLCLVLVCLLPLGMNLMYVPVGGIVHDLMVYAVWMYYLLALLMADYLINRLPDAVFKFKKGLSFGSMLLVFALLYSNVQVANVIYLKKDLEQDSFLSMMTQIVYRMEQTEEYKPGETPVVFVGSPEQRIQEVNGFEKYQTMTGADESNVADLQINYRVQRYFHYILANPAIMASNELWDALQSDSRVHAMPSYPEDGCTQIVDGVLVVKVGDN